MKRILLLILMIGSFALPSLAQGVKPVEEDESRVEEYWRNLFKKSGKLQEILRPKSTADKIDKLYLAGFSYMNLHGITNDKNIAKAAKKFGQMAELCKETYGEHSLQYVVALALLDCIDKSFYDYVPRNQQIGHLLDSLYSDRKQCLHCLTKLLYIVSRQVYVTELLEKGKWMPTMFHFLLDNPQNENFFMPNFSTFCKSIDPFCYPDSWENTSTWYKLNSPLTYSLQNENVSSYVVRYAMLLGCRKDLFTSEDILESVREEIKATTAHFTDASMVVEYIRPLLNVEVSSRASTNPSSENIDAIYDAALMWKGMLMQTDKRLKMLADPDYVDFMSITWPKVQQSLIPEDVAIEFVRLPQDVGATYYALTLRPNYEHPHLIPLCDESALMARNGLDAFEDDSVYNVIWAPLTKEIQGAKNIYFSADGLLHNIPIEYISDDNKQIFADAEEGRKVIRLSSTREIYLNRKHTDFETATIYGGIKYATDTTTMKSIAERYVNDINASASDNLLASHDRSVDALRDMTFGYLDYTLHEAENVDTLCKRNGIKSTLYTGDEGSESSFKALSGKDNNIIHIATHGFYIEEFAAKAGMTPLTDKYRSNLDREGNIIDDPMLRSGLLFSGSDNTINDVAVPEGVDDGILFSKEVGNLDLHKTDLVVLSACQTAKGKIDSEGVYGLQRGFKQAGVGSMLMSLWSVNDEATLLLMSDLYDQLLDQHKSKYEALKHSRNKLRMIPEYSSPRYWAAFILLDP